MPILQKLSHWSRDRKNNIPVVNPEQVQDHSKHSRKANQSRNIADEKNNGAVEQRSQAGKSGQIHPSSTQSVPNEKPLRKKLSKIRPPSQQNNTESHQPWSEDPFLDAYSHQKSSQFSKSMISTEQQGTQTVDLSRNYSLPRRIVITSTTSPRSSADTMSSEYSAMSVETALTIPSSVLSYQEVLTPPPAQKRGRSICIRSSLDVEPQEVMIPIPVLIPTPASQPRSRSMPRSHSRWNPSISSTHTSPSYTLFPPRPSTSHANRPDIKPTNSANTVVNSPIRHTRCRSSTVGEQDRSNDSWNQYFEQYPQQLVWSLEPPSPPPTRALPPIPPIPPLNLPKRPATAHGTSAATSQQISASPQKPSTRSRANSSTHSKNASHSRKRSVSIPKNEIATIPRRNSKILPPSQTSTAPPIPLRRSRSVSHTGLNRPQPYLMGPIYPPVPSLHVAPLRIRSASNMKASAEAQAREQNIPPLVPLGHSQYSSANLI